VSEYKVTLYFSGVRSGLTEEEFDTLLYKNTKHAPFSWSIDSFHELVEVPVQIAECDCE
jgi:hypothetical protein